MIADAERIHTQTIAWILLLDGEFFSNKAKSTFLQALFNIKDEIKISGNFEVNTEFYNIDLLIETDEWVFVIENKLKSSEHSNQTERYEEFITKKFSGVLPKFGFLTLIKDEPKSKKWVSISFEALKAALEKVFNDNISKTNKCFVFIQEYIDTLNNLVLVFNNFIKNPSNFPNVFTDGKKKKHEKKEYPEELQNYIRNNQLETIFQKIFLKKLLGKAVEELSPLKELSWEVGETRGNALIQIYLGRIGIEENAYVFGLQLQQKTLKINLADEDYLKSSKDQIDDKLKNTFERIFKNNNYTGPNPPKTKAYLSVSKKLSKELYEFTVDALSKILIDEIKELIPKIKAFKDEYKHNS